MPRGEESWWFQSDTFITCVNIWQYCVGNLLVRESCVHCRQNILATINRFFFFSLSHPVTFQSEWVVLRIWFFAATCSDKFLLGAEQKEMHRQTWENGPSLLKNPYISQNLPCKCSCLSKLWITKTTMKGRYSKSINA
jgi:hypothetical protein